MMGIRYFTIEYDREIFYPGQVVSGHVRLSLDIPTEIKGIEFTISGEATCHWSEQKRYTDTDGESHTRHESYDGKETYFKKRLTLAGGGSRFESLIGDYVYPFSISLPDSLPPTFGGTYGGIRYFGEAKLIRPWTSDKCDWRPFLVENPIDLNKMPELNKPHENETSKTFCCWCCASRPLTVSVYLPRTGFAYTEAIPVTIEVENASNVKINSVKIELNQIIKWIAEKKSKSQKITMKEHTLGGVRKKASRTWTQEIGLGPCKYPHSGNSGIIRIKYELRIELDPKGLHCNLEIIIPVTIGAIPYGGSSFESMGVGPIPSEHVLPSTGLGYNPGPIGFAPTCPPSSEYPYGGGPQVNFTPPYPGYTGNPYSGGATSTYPGTGGPPYPGSSGA